MIWDKHGIYSWGWNSADVLTLDEWDTFQALVTHLPTWCGRMALTGDGELVKAVKRIQARIDSAVVDLLARHPEMSAADAALQVRAALIVRAQGGSDLYV